MHLNAPRAGISYSRETESRSSWGDVERSTELRVFSPATEGGGGVCDSCLPTPSHYEVALEERNPNLGRGDNERHQ